MYVGIEYMKTSRVVYLLTQTVVVLMRTTVFLTMDTQVSLQQLKLTRLYAGTGYTKTSSLGLMLAKGSWYL
jgi:hypothetical protein